MPEEFVTNERFNKLDNKVDSIDQRLKRVEDKLEGMEERLLAAFERHTSKLLAGPLLEEFVHRLEVIGEGFRIHEDRITKLEIKTGLK